MKKDDLSVVSGKISSARLNFILAVSAILMKPYFSRIFWVATFTLLLSFTANANSDSQECVERMKSVVDLMKSASTGQYVSEGSEVITYEREKVEPKRPQQIGILIDKECASSCEQFLLTVRQSFSVKKLGRRTYGALDYSNLRPHVLPSGNYELYYATSRSLRLPYFPVDTAGVIPDVYLVKTEHPDTERREIIRVKNWIEGGSLADTEE